MALIEVDFNEVGFQHIPEDNRKPIFKAFIKVILSGIKSLFNTVKARRNKNLYELKRDGTVRQLEALLNDEYDMAYRRIKIVDAPVQYEPVYIYQDAEQKPVHLYTDAEDQPLYTFTDYEIEFLGIDFIVQIPYTIPYDSIKMTALLEKYKMPGMTYSIEQT